jgi:hypothetical protein
MNLVALVVLLIITVLSLVVGSHITKLLNAFLVVSLYAAVTWVALPKSILPMVGQIAVEALMLAIYIAILKNRIVYDFTRRVISLKYLYHLMVPVNTGDRVVGRVLPYNMRQMKYNGRYIIADPIAAAGATLVSGSSGSGKTCCLVSMMKQNIKNGQPVIFSEYKGDPKVIKNLVEYAHRYGYDVYRLSDGAGDFNYDPLQGMNNAGRIEAIINMRKWSMDGADAHYRTSVQLLLQKLVGEFSHQWKPEDGPYTLRFYEHLVKYNPSRDEWDAHTTTVKLLELLITSTLAPMFHNQYDKTLSFERMLESGKRKFLVIISFISSNKELATSFSSLMFKDLLDAVTNHPPMDNIYNYVDEFGTLENPFIIKDVLEKGRSGKLATTIALQDINQIVIQTNEAYLNSILGIINTFIVYSGATRTTAEKFAGVQLQEIEAVIMNLRKPINGHKPTAIYISKYPSLNKRTVSEVFRFEPYMEGDAGIFDGKHPQPVHQMQHAQSNHNDADSIQSQLDELNEHMKQSDINSKESSNSNNDHDNGFGDFI